MTKFREFVDSPARIFAVGDIHGCVVELKFLLSHLESTQGLGSNDLVVFIGDYIDRGPDSKGVIDCLMDFRMRFSNTIFLRGNHEDMFLSYLGLPGTLGEVFLANGGIQTLASYGIAPDTSPEEIVNLMPTAHYSFFLNLENYVITPRYVLVHAGLNPLRDLRSQLDEHLFWIRDEFIHNIHHFEKTVIFGHTPYQDIMMHLPYKIGIDTGLVYGNKLSCLEVFSGKVFQIDRGNTEIVEKTLEVDAAARA